MLRAAALTGRSCGLCCHSLKIHHLLAVLIKMRQNEAGRTQCCAHTTHWQLLHQDVADEIIPSSRSHCLGGWQLSFSEAYDWNSLAVWSKSIHTFCSGFYRGIFPSFFKVRSLLLFCLFTTAPEHTQSSPVGEGHGPYLVLSRLWLQSACQRKAFLWRHLVLSPGPPAAGRTQGHTVPRTCHGSALTSPSHTSWIRGKVHL